MDIEQILSYGCWCNFQSGQRGKGAPLDQFDKDGVFKFYNVTYSNGFSDFKTSLLYCFCEIITNFKNLVRSKESIEKK